jgi:hypothetical protein
MAKKTKEAKKRTCCFTDLVEPTLDQLLRIAPSNPTSRAQLLALIKVPVPDDITSYEGIVDWVESNIKSGSEVDLGGTAFTYTADFQVNDTVRGTYQRTRYASVPSTMTIGEVLEEARDYISYARGEGMSLCWRDFEAQVREVITGKANDLKYNTAAPLPWIPVAEAGTENIEVLQAGGPDDVSLEINGSIGDYLYRTLQKYAPKLLLQIDK